MTEMGSCRIVILTLPYLFMVFIRQLYSLAELFNQFVVNSFLFIGNDYGITYLNPWSQNIGRVTVVSKYSSFNTFVVLYSFFQHHLHLTIYFMRAPDLQSI